ncbi:MAG: 2-C-methyl-D-erythritol 2,4-cyclodiphosphate synthase, partial [Fibrobacter sp.]|nr:2-C-methyl-D-erythritol 2,4-cyclodiphosphate synthase [Fibrobacter sp.]
KKTPAEAREEGMELLRKVGEEVKKAGYEIINIDSVVMCERPKVNPHKEQMKANIARVLGLDVKQIGIKGTTTEKLGFTGRGEGIASQAVAMVRSL